MVLQELRETVVLQEVLDLLDHLVLSERVVQKDLPEKSAHQDVMVLQEFPDLQVFQVSKERADLVEMLEHLVFKDPQDQKVAVEHLDQLEFAETKEHLENVEIEEKKVIKVLLVFLDYLVHQVNQETQVC